MRAANPRSTPVVGGKIEVLKLIDGVERTLGWRKPLFRCLIRGENFPGELIGLTAAVGFHATRFVEAESAKQAEQIAVAALREDAALTVTVEPRVKNAKVYFDSIEEVPADTPRMPDTGFTFFIMDNKS
jgi:hypothetical protein